MPPRPKPENPPTYRELLHGARLLYSLAGWYRIPRTHVRSLLYILSTDAALVGALETISSVIHAQQVKVPGQVARAGIEWLDEMQATHHARVLEKPFRRLIRRGCDAMQIAETFNDAGFDLEHNGGVEFSELQIRRMGRILGVKLPPMGWR